MNSEKDLTIAGIRESIKKMTPEERKIITPFIDKISNSGLIIPDETLTHSKVRGFKLQDRFYEADNHIDILKQIIEIVFRNYPNEIEKILSLKGRKNPHFSINPNNLRMPKKIRGTNIYYESNENAKTLQARCEKILKHYGMDYLSFEVISYR